MRRSGILMHITSLPSTHGIGTLGRAAHGFAEFLAKAGQSLWQVLPIGPTGFGDSPYSCFSAFAGNPYMIDLDMLIEDGLLSEEDLAGIHWGRSREAVDFGAIYRNRFRILRKAYGRRGDADREALNHFKEENADWVKDYALYMAIKSRHDMKPWTEWGETTGRRYTSLPETDKNLSEEAKYWIFLQYLFFKQWGALKAHAHALGILLVGDIPFYVAADSVDVWRHHELFDLDENMQPIRVAGCPPDFFSPTGQLWGNPLYAWERHAQTGYDWWTKRTAHLMKIFDIIRIDHFRGFEAYYAVPYGDKTAENGTWMKGPGISIFRTMEEKLGRLPIIAEDLGTLTPEVGELLRDTGFPGMRVLQFAFSGEGSNPYLPHNHIEHCVAYTGTHDNATAREWLGAGGAEACRAAEYLGLNRGEGLCEGFNRGVLSSVADTAIIPMQDYLGLGSRGRMNTPSTGADNWRWRMAEGTDMEALARKIRRMAELFGRISIQ
jgi:4-alpha-glucanotransferase